MVNKLQRLYLYHEWNNFLNLSSFMTFPLICSTCVVFTPFLASLSTSFSSLEFFSHTHLTIATFTAMHPLSLLLHFHYSSLRELIASFFVLAEQQGNNGRVGLVVVATGMGGGQERKEGDKEEREWEQAQRGCWLLAGRQGSEHQLITLGSMHTAIKPWCSHMLPVLRISTACSAYTKTCSATSERKSKQKRC